MKKAILYSLLVILILSIQSCKKDSENSNSGYYIKANINGTEQTFTQNAQAVDIYGDFANYLSLSASYHSDATFSLPDISLNLFHYYAPVKPGTYVQSSKDSNVYLIEGIYNVFNPALTTYSAGFNAQANPSLKITITQITDKIVSGTFEGQYFDTSLIMPPVTITNGEFNLPFH